MIALIGLIFIAGIWGANFSVVKLALEGLSALELIALRSLIAVIFGLVCLKSSAKPTSHYKLSSKWFLGLIPGVLLLLATWFQTMGLQYTTPTRSAFFTSLSFLFVPWLTKCFEKKHPQTHYFVASFVGILGMFFLFNPDLKVVTKGDFLTLLSAMAYGAYFYCIKLYREQLGNYWTYMLQMLTMLAISFGLCELNPEITFMLDSKSVYAVLFIGIFATGIPYYLLIKLQKNISPERVAFVLALEPVFAGLTSYVVFNERLSDPEITGCLLIFLAVFIHEKLLIWPHNALKRLTSKQDKNPTH